MLYDFILRVGKFLQYSLAAHSPGASNSFVVIFRIDSQDADPGANVDQQQRIRVLQRVGFLGAVVRIRGVLQVVALGGSAGHGRVNVEHPTNQAIQLVQLVELQVSHLWSVFVEGGRGGAEGGGGVGGGMTRQVRGHAIRNQEESETEGTRNETQQEISE